MRLSLDRRPDLMVARFQAMAARDYASEPLLRIVPVLGVQGQLAGTTAPTGTHPWNDENIQATLTWTIYDAGNRYADKHSRDAQAEIASLNVQNLARNIDAQVRSAVALLVSAQAQFHVADDTVKYARAERRGDGRPLPAGAGQGDRAGRRQ